MSSNFHIQLAEHILEILFKGLKGLSLKIKRELIMSNSRNISSSLYYDEVCINCIAYASWDTFKDSWAGQQWIKRNRNRIEELYENYKKRFSYTMKIEKGI